MIMCLFPRTQFVCRLIGEVGEGGSMIMCLFFPCSQFVCRLIGEVEVVWVGGGGEGSVIIYFFSSRSQFVCRSSC